MLRSARTFQVMGAFALGQRHNGTNCPRTLSPQFRFETPPPAYTADGQEGLKPLATPGLAPPYSEQGGSTKKTYPVITFQKTPVITLGKEVDVAVTIENRVNSRTFKTSS